MPSNPGAHFKQISGLDSSTTDPNVFYIVKALGSQPAEFKRNLDPSYLTWSR